MSDKTKKILKITGITIGATVGGIILGAAWIGFGNIFHEHHFDPENYMHTSYQCARYGWSVVLGDGWAA